MPSYFGSNTQPSPARKSVPTVANIGARRLHALLRRVARLARCAVRARLRGRVSDGASALLTPSRGSPSSAPSDRRPAVLSRSSGFGGFDLLSLHFGADDLHQVRAIVVDILRRIEWLRQVLDELLGHLQFLRTHAVVARELECRPTSTSSSAKRMISSTIASPTVLMPARCSEFVRMVILPMPTMPVRLIASRSSA